MRANFSEHTMTVFSEFKTDHEQMTNLMTDLALGREMFDGDRKISKAEANEKIRQFSLAILEIGDSKDVKTFKRAWEDHGKEWFRVLEDTVDNVIETGLQESEWFNDLVERKTMNFYDRQDFYIDSDNAILSVAKAGVSHNTHPLQRIGRGRTVSLTPDLYVVKVGADINRFIAGQEDFARLVNAIAIGFMKKFQGDVYAAVDTAANLLPVQGTDFINTGILSAGTKGAFDKIVSNVSYANPGAEIVIMGTNNALKNLNALGDVSWISNLAKDSVYNTGRMGLYEGTRLVEIDNRFTDKTYKQTVFNDKKLLILPVIGDAGKFVKMIDAGTIEIEHTERDEKYSSDLMTMQVSRWAGIGVVIGHQFGQWTI